MSDFISWSQKDAEKVKKYLLENHKGQLVKKSAVRIKFDIPYTRSAMVFNILESEGWDVTKTSIVVPKP